MTDVTSPLSPSTRLYRALGAVAAKVLILAFIVGFIQFRPQGLFPERGRVID